MIMVMGPCLFTVTVLLSCYSMTFFVSVFITCMQGLSLLLTIKALKVDCFHDES